MAKAQDEYDAACLLLVMINEDLEYLLQALQDTPADLRLAMTIQQKKRKRAVYEGLVEECRLRLERKRSGD